jgi:hypothetical protein
MSDQSTDAAMRLVGEAADALMELLDDTQHKEHPDCEDGYCPVRDARVTLLKLQQALDVWRETSRVASPHEAPPLRQVVSPESQPKG